MWDLTQPGVIILEEENSAREHLRLAVAISTDRDHFLRRTCPSCGRDFKTPIDPNELQWALGLHCQRMGLDVGPENAHPSLPDQIRCPYCGHEDQSSRMHTEETVAYLKRILYREVVIPQVNKLFSGLEKSSGTGGDPGGLFSISIEFKHSRSLLPVRPIHGPEPADQKIVTFLCCGKKIKVSEGWTDIHTCSFCGAQVVLI